MTIRKILACVIAFAGLAIAANMRTEDRAPAGRDPPFKARIGGLDERDRETDRIFRELLRTHPHEEIRNDLMGLMRRGEVLPSYDVPPGAAVMGSMAVATYLDTPDGQVLVLMISRESLLDPDMPREIKQLVIYHEWIHIKQQREKRYSKWLLLPHDMDYVVNEDELRTIFESEDEAYLAECKLAVRIQVADQLNFCQAFVEQGERGMRRQIARNFSQTIFWQAHLGFLERLATE